MARRVQQISKSTPRHRRQNSQGQRAAAMDPQRLPLPAPLLPASSPYSALHPLLLPSPNPHLLLKPKTLTLSLSSSSLGSMASCSSPPPAPAPDAWEFVAPTAATAAQVADELDDCAVFPPRLHEGLGLDGEPEEEEEEAAASGGAAKEVEDEGEEDEEGDDECLWAWGWRWERCRLAARRAWAAGVGAVQDGMFERRACGCPAVRPAVWSAAAAAVAVGALLYARRRDRRERNLLVLLSQEKDKRIAQLLHQIALMSDIRNGSEAVKIIRSS